MSHVSVTINGRAFRMACDEGQESHLLRLGEDLDKRIANLKARLGKERFNESGDSRLVVMAAVEIADDLDEMRKRVSRLEEEIASLKHAGAAAKDRTQATQSAIIAALNAAAERIEGVTKSLNQTLGNGGVALG
jgi:cell division protein ZapA